MSYITLDLGNSKDKYENNLFKLKKKKIISSGSSQSGKKDKHTNQRL